MPSDAHSSASEVAADLFSAGADEPDVDLLNDAESDYDEDESDLAELNQPASFDAVVARSDWTTETLLSQVRRGNLQLDPDFQRRDAWDRRRKSRFVESVITGLPVPEIVLAELPGQRGRYIVLDGKQRLLALWQFAGSADGASEGYRLTGLELRADLNGNRFGDLRPEDRVAFENQTIRTVVVRNWKSEDFLYLVFYRLNTGSVPLSPQELRQALSPGEFVRFVNAFTAEREEFRQLLRRKTADFRMRDVELLVRFFAFDRFLPEYTGNLKHLLDMTCDRLNASWEVEEGSIRHRAEDAAAAIRYTFDSFGEFAFRRWNGYEWERPFNRAVFDAMVFYASDMQVGEAMTNFGAETVDRFVRLCSDDSRFMASITSTTKSIEAIHYRLSAWGMALSEVLGEALPVPQLVDGRIGYTTV